MAVESPVLVNHEVIADHALLLSEAADVLLDMAMSPSNRTEDLEDIESIQAEAASFPAEPGLPRLIDAMFADVLALARGLAQQSAPLPPPMVSECRAVVQIANTLSAALETGGDARHTQSINRCAIALDPDAHPGIDLDAAVSSGAGAIHMMRLRWSVTD
jgi:hypothetical protein